VNRSIPLILSIAALALSGCNSKPVIEQPNKPAATAPAPTASQLPPGHPQVGQAGGNPHAGMKALDLPPGVGKKARVTQAISRDGKTFLELVDEKGEKLWLAMPEVKVSVGNSIEYPEAPVMEKFHSKTLNRDLERVSFVPGIRVVK
jgi:hypothetical protein